MGNTLDMNKIRDDHQARTERLIQASAFHLATMQNYSDEAMVAAYSDMLKELAAIWREEAQRLSDIVAPKPRGWKTTMESLRDCATRVMGVAVAMDKYGLPGDSAPKDAGTAPGAAREGESSTAAPASPAMGDAASLLIQGASPDFPPVLIRAGQAPSELPDLVGDFLRDLGRAPNAGDWTKLDGHGQLLIVDDPHEETLEQAAASIIKQVRTAEEIDAGQVKVIKQAKLVGVNLTGEPLVNDMKIQEDQPTMTMQYKDDPANLDPVRLTVGTADAPPAWASAPPATVYELTDDPAGWLPSPDHSSVSQANLAGECQMKWWLEKRRGAGGRPSWALVGGKAFHECVRVLETYDWSNIKPVSELWNTAFAEAIEETQRENPDWPQDTWHASNKGKEGMSWWNLDGPEMVHRYLAWRNDFRNQGWELLKTNDGRAVVELEFLAFLGGGPVKGFVDQAWYHPIKNVIVIVDLKSGSSTPADFFQQATYRHALEPLLGVFEYLSQVVWAGAFYDARKGELGAPVDLDVRHSRAEVEMRLSGPRRIDAAGLYMPNVNTGYGGCNSCSLKRSCPVGSRIGKGEISL